MADAFIDQSGKTKPLPSKLGKARTGSGSAVSRAKFKVFPFASDGKVKGKGFELPIQFRPNKFTFASSAEWCAPGQKGDKYKRHIKTKPGDLSLNLFYDTTGWEADVRIFVTPVIALTHAVEDSWFKTKLSGASSDVQKNSAPLVRFEWGSITSYLSYVSSVNADYDWFHPAGFPMRASVSVTLNAFLGNDTKPLQNPTSRSEARGTHVVGFGQTLEQIAFEHYGDVGYWRHLADTNDLRDPMRLKPGQLLKLVPLD